MFMATARRKDLLAVNKDGAHQYVDEQDDEHLIYIMVSKLYFLLPVLKLKPDS